MDFDALQDKKRLKKMIEEDETAEESDLVAEEEEESEGPESDEEASDIPGEPAAEMPSPESLLNSYKLLEQKIAQLEQEAASYRRMFEEVGLSNRGLQRRADEEKFMRLMRESFQKDPIGNHRPDAQEVGRRALASNGTPDRAGRVGGPQFPAGICSFPR